MKWKVGPARNNSDIPLVGGLGKRIGSFAPRGVGECQIEGNGVLAFRFGVPWPFSASSWYPYSIQAPRGQCIPRRECRLGHPLTSETHISESNERRRMTQAMFSLVVRQKKWGFASLVPRLSSFAPAPLASACAEVPAYDSVESSCFPLCPVNWRKKAGLPSP